LKHRIYHPGSQLLTVKLSYQPNDGKLLGAQIAGQVEVVKRIKCDCCTAALLYCGGTLEDLAYAPLVSPVAANQTL
jgi:hypothetical protein